MTYRFLTPASRELSDAVSYYEGECLGLGSRFLDHIEITIDLILRFPNAWRVISENHNVSRKKVPIRSDLYNRE